MPSKDYYQFKGESVNENDSQINLLAETALQYYNSNQQIITEISSSSHQLNGTCRDSTQVNMDSDSSNSSPNDDSNFSHCEHTLNKIKEKEKEIHMNFDKLLIDNERMKTSLDTLKEAIKASNVQINPNTFIAHNSQDEKLDTRKGKSRNIQATDFIKWVVGGATFFVAGFASAVLLYRVVSNQLDTDSLLNVLNDDKNCSMLRGSK